MDGNTLHDSLFPSELFRVRDPMSTLTHFIAFLAAIFGTSPLLIHAAQQKASLTTLISLSIFMLSMISLYGASSAYHAFFLSDKGTTVLKKLDHTMIFFLIAGSYTPVCVVKLGSAGTKLLLLVWALALAGAIFKLCWITCPKWVSSVIYIAMGWSCLTAMPQLLAALDNQGFFWLLLGGIFYTVGGILYALKPKCLEGKAFGIHEIFHVFVMAGSLCHYVFMYRFL